MRLLWHKKEDYGWPNNEMLLVFNPRRKDNNWSSSNEKAAEVTQFSACMVILVHMQILLDQ